MGLSKKLILIFSALVIGTFLLVFSFTYVTTQKVIEDKFGYLLHEIVLKTVMNMDAKINEIDRSMNMLVINGDYTRNFSFNPKKETAFDKVAKLAMAKETSDIMIYSSRDLEAIIINLAKENQVLGYGKNLGDPHEILKETKEDYKFFFNPDIWRDPMVYAIWKEGKGKTWTSGLNGNYNELYLTRKFNDWDTGKNYGIITFVMDMKVFTGPYKQIEEKFSASNILIDNEGTIVSHTDESQIGQPLSQELEDMISHDQDMKYQTYNNQLISYAEAENGWYYISMIPMKSITSEVADAWRLSSIIILLGIAAAIFIFFTYTKRISKNMSVLINKMFKVEEGVMEIGDTLNTKDEIGTIDHYFTRMVGKLKTLITKNYIQELEKREAELSALQFQINPHFLYNTLESMGAIGIVYGSDEINQISQKLGKMLRYSLNISTSEFVPFSEELNHIKNYFFIQEIRFEDRFAIEYDIEEEAKTCRVIKLILQPIVENALQHGLNEEDEGQIKIEARCVDNRLIVVISDNGKGMSDEQVQSINDYIGKNTDKILTGYKKSVGMRNVNLRIKLAYGERYGLWVESEEGVGTKVTYTLPKL